MNRIGGLFILLLSILIYGFQPVSPQSIVPSSMVTPIPQAVKKKIWLKQPLSLTTDQMVGWLRETFDVQAATSFQHQSSFTDQLGLTHHRYQQTYKGYPVQDGVVILHMKGKQVIGTNGEFYPSIKLDIHPSIRPTEAIAIGQQSIDAEQWAEVSPPVSCIIVTPQGYRHAYKTDLFAYSPMTRKWLFVDTQTGTVVAERDQIHHLTVPAEAHCYYHGIQTIRVDSIGPSEYLLHDYSRGDGIITRNLNGSSDLSTAVEFRDTDKVWDSTANDDHAALDVHWATGLIYDYMLEAHNWESYDNQGAAVYNYIHHSNRFNASWTGSGMVFGDGDGSFFNPLTAAEVVGHEFMHAYSSTTVNWNNSNLETGSLNESYSDIFSVLAEFHISPSTANYLIGDMVTVSGEPIRNLVDPNATEDPDTYLGQYWSNSRIDQNSNVFSHCFYLLTQGGSGVNDNGDAYVVDPISRTEAGDILFRAMSVYMTPNTNFADARTHGIQACRDLYGPCSPQEVQFTNACYAVGIGAAYTGPPITEIQSDGDLIVGEELRFSSNATNAIQWNWDFGDNTTSTEEMPRHTYQSMGTYEVILSASYSGGCIMTDTLQLIVTDLTSTEALEKFPVFIYPNPAQEHLFIEYPLEETLNGIRIIDALGRQHLFADDQKTYPYQIAVRSLPAGIYFLEMEFENRPLVFRKFYVN